MNLDQCLATAGASVLVVAPHPDDESLGAGGLIQRALMHGAQVSIVFVTDGDNNPWPQRALERRIVIGARQRARWGERRRAEAQRALQILGATDAAVHRLAWPDGGVTWKLVDDTRASITQWRALLDQTRPTLLVLPDIADGHPDHSALHVLVELALCGMPEAQRPQCLGYLLHGRDHRETSQCVTLTLTPQEQARKCTAIEAHASQIALSRGRLMRLAGTQEIFSIGVDNREDNGSLRANRLPWRRPRWLRPAMKLLAVDALGGQRVQLDGNAQQSTLCWRDGSPAAHLPRAPTAPCYVKLYAAIPSPWVFDHWGWKRLEA